MKKTLTVNLGGTVVHIDEDAYQLLDKYLANLRIHFRKEEGSEEIMNDFEMRISELLNERVRLGHEVITIEHVEEVIRRMGKPEELFEGEEEKEYKEEAKTYAFQEEEIPRGSKKLMRDPDNRVLGGVAGGIAAYMGWDVTAVRLAMIILLFVPYAPIIILYLILWLVMPLARTAADKLMMRGQSVTLENIGKTVTDGFEKVSNNVNNYMSSDKPRSFLQKLVKSGEIKVNGKFHPQIPGHTDRDHPAAATATCRLHIDSRHLCPYCRRHWLPVSIVAIRSQPDSGSTYSIGNHGLYRLHSADRHSYLRAGICHLHAVIQSKTIAQHGKMDTADFMAGIRGAEHRLFLSNRNKRMEHIALV